MGYTYTPTYYSSLQDSITSICKSILPFSLNKPRLAAAEQKLLQQQADNLKWQQNSYHKILNLMGLQKEGICAESDVSAFRSQLLETLSASKGVDHEQPPILKDKLIFLQELLYAKCISAEEYHASKRPLLQRLAVQGAEIEARDVIVGSQKDEVLEEEWSVIDLKDEQTLLKKENSGKPKYGLSAVKHIKGAASVFGYGSSQKSGKMREKRSIFDNASNENPFCMNNQIGRDCDTSNSILMSESPSIEKMGKVTGKKKAFLGFDGLKRWKKSNMEDSEKRVIEGGGPDTKQIKRKILSDGSPSSGFFIDKVLGDNIKKELSRIQTELSSTNPNFRFSNDEMDAISTKLPVDKADLKQFFPKSWCDRYGDVVLDVVKKEFKEHVGEMENTRNANLERRQNNSRRWNENSHPNLFSTNSLL